MCTYIRGVLYENYIMNCNYISGVFNDVHLLYIRDFFHDVQVVSAARALQYPAVERLLRSERAEGRGRPAHILGGWSTSTPRFPKNHWEIVKSMIFR